jgi:hypothetical protein
MLYQLGIDERGTSQRSPSQSRACLSRLGRDAAATELPLGYAGTMAMALVPPLWRAVMHPRLDRMAAREAW